MSIYLARLASFSFRRRRLMAGIWVAIFIGVIALAQLSGGKTIDDFSVPGTQAQKAVDVLKQKLPALSGASTQVVLVTHGQAKVTDPSQHAALKQVVATLAKTPQVSLAMDPIRAKTVSPDGTAALMQVQYTVAQGDVHDSTLDAVKAAMQPARAAGMQVEFSGALYPGSRAAVSELPELIGIGVGLAILIVTFGAVLVAFIPILTAIFGVAISLMLVTILSSMISVVTISTSLATMLGLSCGIDYALFLVSRYRNHVMAGVPTEEAIALAAGTAGSSVVFAALTVVIALCGLAVVGIPFLTVMGVCAAGAVLLSLIIALTLLPALLGFAGLRVVRFIRLPFGGDRAEVARIGATEPLRTGGARWARLVTGDRHDAPRSTRHKLTVGAIAIAAMVVVALPLLDLRLGLPSGDTKPKSETSHKAYALTTEHFGVGANGPLVVVADLANARSAGATDTVVQALAAEPNVASAVLTTSANKTALIQVTPTGGPNDTITSDLVKRIRTDSSALQAKTGVKILVGGTTASNIDTSKKLSSALPVFLLVVVGLAFILLTLAFRTILVPIKSILGFLLSICAAFGAEVAVFQWGWLAGPLGVQKGETLSFLPILSLAIIFGLSSDYEVFVVSRIKEHFTKTGEEVGSVIHGTAGSARVVSAAALIMFAVFVAFMFNSDPSVKAIGLTLAVGVFLDAFVVRLTLVPAVMALVKGRFWYHPQWFADHVPDLDIEGEKLERLFEAQHAGEKHESIPSR